MGQIEIPLGHFWYTTPPPPSTTTQTYADTQHPLQTQACPSPPHPPSPPQPPHGNVACSGLQGRTLLDWGVLTPACPQDHELKRQSAAAAPDTAPAPFLGVPRAEGDRTHATLRAARGAYGAAAPAGDRVAGSCTCPCPGMCLRGGGGEAHRSRAAPPPWGLRPLGLTLHMNEVCPSPPLPHAALG